MRLRLAHQHISLILLAHRDIMTCPGQKEKTLQLLGKECGYEERQQKGYECNSYLSMSGAGGQRLKSHLDLKGLQGQAGALAREGQGLQGKRPPSRRAESGLKQAGACTEDLGGELCQASPRQGIETREARGHQVGWLKVA